MRIFRASLSSKITEQHFSPLLALIEHCGMPIPSAILAVWRSASVLIPPAGSVYAVPVHTYYCTISAAATTLSSQLMSLSWIAPATCPQVVDRAIISPMAPRYIKPAASRTPLVPFLCPSLIAIEPACVFGLEVCSIRSPNLAPYRLYNPPPI
jgi:hypothetical protein